jgi:dTDP-6-deoxy-L-talose 4-dehydrogenase (NAD+)
VEFENSIDSFLTSQKLVCVSGSTGFLGRAIVLKLNKHGYRVLALSRQSLGNQFPKVTSEINYVSGTIDDWEEAIGHFKPDVIISCDWEGVGQEFRNEPLQDLNFERITRLGKIAVQVKAKIFLSFGSQAEIAPSTESIDESVLESPQNFYGLAKIEALKTLNLIAANSVTKIIWGRIFTIYGPGDTRKSIVTEGIRKAILGEEFVIAKPNLKWSFLYIDDFTDAILKILENEDLPGIINIGNPVDNYRLVLRTNHD